MSMPKERQKRLKLALGWEFDHFVCEGVIQSALSYEREGREDWKEKHLKALLKDAKALCHRLDKGELPDGFDSDED